MRTIASLFLGALIIFVVGVQCGEYAQRERTVPVQITAEPCLEAPKELCLFDAARKREVRVLGDGRVVYATSPPNVPNHDWSVQP